MVCVVGQLKVRLQILKTNFAVESRFRYYHHCDLIYRLIMIQCKGSFSPSTSSKLETVYLF